MKNTVSDNSRFALTLILVAAFLITASGCATAPQEREIIFTKYPNLKLGFTTANFLPAMPLSFENSKKLIDYADREGYAWIELRDPHADLTLDECKQLAQYAKSKQIEVAYAIHEGIFDDKFFQTFDRGVKNASCFEGPKTIRTTVCGNLYNDDLSKIGFTADEMTKLLHKANRAAKVAKVAGLKLVLENGFEAIEGDGKTYFGTTELLDRTNPDVGWQFDTGNFFCTSRLWTKPEDAEAFMKKYIRRLSYIHLKTSQNKTVQKVLGDSELDFDVIFAEMSKHNIPYVAIEILGVESAKKTYANHRKSTKYLKKRGFITIK